jgi:hypothetical protein
MAKIGSITIEDGFDKPVGNTPIGDVVAEDRKPEPVGASAGFGDIPTISPFDFQSGAAYTPDDQPKRRGRPVGSKNRSREETQAESHLSANLDGLLLSAHFAVAAFLEVPELEINKTQAEQYADSLKQVMKHYQTTIDPKKLAWVQLIFTMGGIYGPMIPAIRARKAKEPVVAPKPNVVSPKPQQAPTPIDRKPEPQKTGKPWTELTPHELFAVPPGETMESL